MLQSLNNLPVWLTSLISVCIGSFVSYRIMCRQETLRILADFYADVFSTYMAAVPGRFQETTSMLAFIAAAEKTTLLCSEGSEKILNDLITEATKDTPDALRIGKLLQQLKVSAKEDLNRKLRFTLKNVRTKRK